MGYYDFKSKVPRTRIGQLIVEKVTDRIFETVSKYFAPNFEILDIGAGNGEFAERCLRSNYHYTAIEVNDVYIKKLHSLGAKVVNSFVPPIPLPNESYDYVHLSHLLEHMSSNEKAQELILETRRVLKPGGYLCVITPDYLHSPSFFFDGDYTHSFITTENRLKMLLADADYRIIFSKYFTGGQTGLSQWFLSVIGKIYNNYLYWLFQAILKSKIDTTRFSRTRGALARFIFILAQKG
jgi:SAM-dependent methyltransferase